MRTLLSLVLALTIASTEICLSETDEIRLIRRAYIDITGYIPTTTEIEWFTVHSTDGYNTAVNYLLTKYTGDISKDQVKKLLLSKEYIDLAPKPLTAEQIEKQILYVAGMAQKERTPEVVHKAKLKLVEWAIESTFSDISAIDYICQELLNRESRTQEANGFIKILNDARLSHKTQEEQWICVVDEILRTPDMILK